MQSFSQPTPALPVNGNGPVIVFACGRTGSTLLIRILNCLPRTVVWGEHGGMLKPVLRAYSRATEVAGTPFVAEASKFLRPVIDREVIKRRSDMSIEWLNWFGEADIHRIYRELITGLFYPEPFRARFSRWGFKEIQYRSPEYDLLRTLFPDMKAIILYRNPAAVCASQFKNFAKGDAERLPRLLKSIESFYSFAAETAHRAEQASESRPLFISYEEITTEFRAAKFKLQRFLDEEFSSGIAEIAKEVRQFRKGRGFDRPRSSDELLAEFETWAKSVNAELPDDTLQQICYHYRSLGDAIGQGVSSAETVCSAP